MENKFKSRNIKNFSLRNKLFKIVNLINRNEK